MALWPASGLSPELNFFVNSMAMIKHRFGTHSGLLRLSKPRFDFLGTSVTAVTLFEKLCEITSQAALDSPLRSVNPLILALFP